MNVRIFRNMIGTEPISMKTYADRLEEHLTCAHESFTVHACQAPRFSYYLAKEIFYPMRVPGKQADINHITDHSYASLLRFLEPQRTVVTCHDLISLEYPANATWLGRLLFQYNVNFLIKAAGIIADSHHTKSALIKYLRIPGNRIRVVGLGVDDLFRACDDKRILKSSLEKFSITYSQPLVLHVGDRLPYKNVKLLLMALMLKKDFHLIKVGRFQESEQNFIRKNNLSQRIIHIESASLEDLVCLYNVADCLVQPSLYEGFGWPVLEAMRCGCPVICSHRASLPEVAGDAAFYIEGHDPEELVAAITKVLENAALREGMRDKGFINSKKFSWEKMAQETQTIYDKILSNQRKAH